MKNKKRLSLLLAGAMCTSLLAGCGGQPTTPTDPAATAASDLAQVQKNGVLTIGYTDYAPMNYKGDDGELTGFDTEFAKSFCEKLGVEANFVEIVWATKTVELDSGNIDCIWNGMTITDDLKSNLSISNPYAENTQVVITKAENKDTYADYKNLAGKTIALEAGSAAQSVAEQDENLSGANIVTVAQQTKALLEVKSGTADAAIFDRTMADSMIGEGTDFSDLVVCGVFHQEQYGVGFRKDSDLTAKLNETMAAMIEDGSLPALAEKYGLTLAS